MATASVSLYIKKRQNLFLPRYLYRINLSVPKTPQSGIGVRRFLVSTHVKINIPIRTLPTHQISYRFQILRLFQIWGFLSILEWPTAPLYLFWALSLTPITSTSVPKIYVATSFYTYFYTGVKADGAAGYKGLTIQYKAQHIPSLRPLP